MEQACMEEEDKYSRYWRQKSKKYIKKVLKGLKKMNSCVSQK